MTEEPTEPILTDWTVGEGLTEDGFPDPDWRTFCACWPSGGPSPTWHPSDKEHPGTHHWTCQIVYGTQWRHLHYGWGNTKAEATRVAFTKAVKAGMPIVWAPDDLDL